MSQDSRGGSGRRSGRGSGRGQRRSSSRSTNDRRTPRAPQPPPAEKSFWQKLLSFFRPKAPAASGKSRAPYPPYPGAGQGSGNGQNKTRNEPRPTRQARQPDLSEVTTPKLYIGNLSYSATEDDLVELFKGVGMVKSAEVATHRDTDNSKGFGFVTLSTVEEAKRAVTELHDQLYMGRKLVVSGAKISERETDYRG
ncbi:MAG: hypothetical protein K8R23_07035 [Chthoniobacter sp.]|nr:hypothetical protein [Chthoniobacter sp.]